MPNSTIKGAAGEHYVMYQLLRRELIAALAPAGVPNCDIIVSDQVGDRLFAVQVKVRTDDGIPDAWHMGKKHEAISSPNLFYAFVDFAESVKDQPSCWIMPSGVVAKVLAKSHSAWLAVPGAKGQAHNDNPLRRLRKCYKNWHLGPEYELGWMNQYYENWQVLEVATRE